MAHSGWTREPWHLYHRAGIISIRDSRYPTGPLKEIVHWQGFDSSHVPRRQRLANARRIVACVNACQGIPTDALEAGVLQEMRDALQAMLDAFVWAQEAPPLKNPDGSRTGWQFVATRTLERARELLRRSGDPVPDRALARFLGEEASS